ncbi:exodeoxyribonuclease VII small subunit [Lignipirellula cremea]|uniref:Exodeoxyribonuclease 7 small subunit n=1 Tax=Lignipirellula cremea TaxID=2528010 RepID=A0A518DV82_9BACT|nr:exodeoxyribonuclease VII small subunit [Lignipirellula cremea]QDU95745.1 Exodeoxyribonuclease 7 small subunit [Lignipirellula cremea]
MAKKKKTGETAVTFEESLAALETIVAELEDGDLGLSDSLGRYEEGVRHLKHCYSALENAERTIEQLTGVERDGSPRTEPFDDQPTSSDRSDLF